METERIYYTAMQIDEEFDNLSCEDKISILYEALGHMQAWNGRGKFMCIALAMGYDNDEGGRDTYYKQSKENYD
jgi:hypothetical protein